MSLPGNPEINIIVGIFLLIAVITGIVRVLRARKEAQNPNLTPEERARQMARIRDRIRIMLLAGLGLILLFLIMVIFRIPLLGN